ncbi:hypothetical protein [Helcococcus ovis]|uniref:DUF2178 domain-containing protein n=1 Tax=Helcococcus ovis TaxID=72026 RepID=A0A4R9C3L4_9FIRM|nr:hypothetical protein [Helcococcus ovis]TFF63876.1 hypothetical protein EQF92_08095 [Helcococcus ovis]TFF65660.1 hypothetical protein EQF91_05325 [Helcococcus ovis]
MLEKFRKKIKNKTIITSVILFFAVIMLVFSIVYSGKNTNMESVRGFFTGMILVFIFYILRNIQALRSEEKLKKLYAKLNDERIKYIGKKTSETTLIIILIILSFMSIVFATFNIDFSLRESLLVIIGAIYLIYIISYICYSKKY